MNPPTFFAGLETVIYAYLHISQQMSYAAIDIGWQIYSVNSFVLF